MKIQCILERKGGTVTDIGGVEYHFEPLDDGAHVAEVENEAHIDRFLSISEAYKVYHGKGTPKGKPVLIAEPSAIAPASLEIPKAGSRLFGSADHPPSFDVNGKTYSQMEIVKIAFEASRMTEDEWNELPEEDRAARIDMALDDLADAAPGDEGKADAAEAKAEKPATPAKPGRKGKKAA